MDQIAALLDEMFARGIGSGAALSIGDAGREVERMYRGSTRRLPTPGVSVDAHTWFDVASLTKPMATVASAMVLVGDGALDLDDPVRKWLPVATSTGTVRQLLGHGAGCAAHVEFFKRLRVGTHEDPRAELVEMAAAEPSGPPGVAAVYSDLGYIMLGAIIERAAGVPLEEAFVDLVAGPLGLGARFAGTESIERALSRGGNYTKTEDAEERAGGAGGARPIAGQQRAPIPFSGTANDAGGGRPIAGQQRGSEPFTTNGPNVAATEIDERTGVSAVVQGRVHDENAWYGGGVCGHAGLFARIDDVAMFAAAIVDTAAGIPRGRFRTDVVNHFLSTAAAPGSWRLGWDTPSATPGVSHAGDRWSRVGAVGHLGFTGVSLWLDVPNRRWVTLLTNRVHPTRFGDSPEAIKQLRRRVNDFAVTMLGA